MHGRDEALPESVPLRAGPLSLLYEQGDLRYIRLGSREVLRRMYVAVRDRNWGTVPPVLSNVRIDSRDDSFEISYDVSNRQGEIDFGWRGRIAGGADGTITFSMDGEARSTFLRNRIGFCVLHPIRECAGVRCEVEHADGTVEQGEFPFYISPHQPFFDMRAISHEAAPGVRAEVRFEGDVFEMEDQRNWTDASYKTYCTPLRIPYPVEVRRGTRISQSVTLALRGDIPSAAASAEAAPVRLTLGDAPVGSLPRIGLGVASHRQPLSAGEIERLGAINPAHLHVGLDLSGPGYEDALRRAAREAAALGVPLQVALTLSDPAEEIRALLPLLEEVRPDVGAWLVFRRGQGSTPPEWAELARRQLQAYEPGAPVGGGTDAYFTQLNRDRPPAGALDFVSYSINPQVHAFDDLSLVETLEAQASTVESARRFIGDTPLYVTPVTLRPRFNPDATGPEREAGPGELPPQVDPRQMSLFGAAWTVGSIKYLAEGGVANVTYYETTGWRGVMETAAGSPAPGVFRSLPGAVFPLYHVLADVGELAGGEVLPLTSSDPLRAAGLAVRKDGRVCLLLANLSAAQQEIELYGVAGSVRVRFLDDANAVAAMTEPEEYRAGKGERLDTVGGVLRLTLAPYAVAWIDMADEVQGER